MCGISGIVNFNNTLIEENQVHKMIETMHHRGPDDSGVFIDENVGLGFVRLSILDLSSAGHQPMQSNDDKYVIVFNGEVYNYLEIREELSSKYQFKTNTDTEVILTAYLEWGEKCLDKFNGMFAFVIYNKVTGELFGARDRFGIKPFYYFQDSNNFIFASDIPAILSVVQSKITPDDASIFDYLAFGRTDQNESTFFRQIKKLQHGHCVTISPQRKRYEIKKWYDLKKTSRDPITDPDELRNLLRSSVELRMRSDVPVGVSLSGGVDSSSLVGIINKDLGKEDLFTFSSVYHDNHRANEKSAIDLVKLKNSKFVYPTSKGFVDEMDDLLDAHSEPFSTSAIYAQYKVMQLAKKDVTVLLDGQGADEYFGGYPYFHGYYYKGLFNSMNYIRLAKEIATYTKLNKDITNLKYFAYFMSPKFIKQKIVSKQNNYLHDSFLNSNIEQSTIVNELYQSKNLLQASTNHFEYKLEHLLKWEDRNSMHFSIESRVPFLDYRLVEGILATPSKYKIRNGVTKYLLKESVRDIVPSAILNKTNKVGFATPEDLWFRSDYMSKRIDKLLLSKNLMSERYINLNLIKNLIFEHRSGKINASSEIWRWMNLEYWLQKYF